MKNSSRYLLILILLLLSWWLQNLFDSKPELITRDKSRFANYYLEDFKLTAHDKNGKVKYILYAKRLDNYQRESLAEIQSVRTVMLSADTNWTITADKANIFHNQNKIEFYDNVQLSRPKTTNKAALSLSSQSITLFTEKQILETESLVTVTNGSSQFQSKGLHYDNNQGLLKLKSNVRGTYVK